jgi:hypothetical protein
MPLTSRDIIGIKEIRIGGMRRSIAWRGRGQKKGFEKPTRVRQMPLGGAHIRHGLNDIIFRHQRLTETLGKLSHLMITPDQCLLGTGFTRTGRDSRVVDALGESHTPLLFGLQGSGRLRCDAAHGDRSSWNVPCSLRAPRFGVGRRESSRIAGSRQYLSKICLSMRFSRAIFWR